MDLLDLSVVMQLTPWTYIEGNNQLSNLESLEFDLVSEIIQSMAIAAKKSGAFLDFIDPGFFSSFSFWITKALNTLVAHSLPTHAQLNLQSSL